MLENQILQFQFSGIDSIILTIGQIMLFILGGYLVLSQKLSVGEFSVINLYFSSIITTIRYFYSVGTSFQNMRVSFNRIYEFLKIPCIENGSETIDSIINVSIENLKIQFDSKIVISEFHKEFIQGKCISLQEQMVVENQPCYIQWPDYIMTYIWEVLNTIILI